MDDLLQILREMSSVREIIETGDWDGVIKLMQGDRRVDPSDQLSKTEIWGDIPALLSKSYKKGDRSLLMAAVIGHVEAVDLLVSLGAPLEMKVGDGWTPLFFAAHFNHSEVVKRLLHHGADISARNDQNRTALYMAIWECLREIVKLLIAAGSPLDNQDIEGNTPLHRAAGSTKGIAQLLLEAGASPSFLDCNGDSPLHLAARKNKSDVVRALAPVTDLNLVGTN